MKLTLIRKDRLSGDTNCPAMYRTETGDYVVVGRVLSDTSEVSAGLADDEAAVLVPANVLRGTEAP